ncbi:MAG: acyl-CoA/acyl-ACP dehydrogenase [Alphaproteobacteria bacterium]|nr:acyl-CoA/acyl-ACP dehydrogenase [Alphaproteobacteria bacterium]
MQFEWSPETRQRIAAARDFAEKTLRPRGRSEGLDHAGWQAAARFGVFRSAMPPRFGLGRSRDGSNGALVSAALFEAMGRGGADRGLLFAMGAHLFGCLVPLAAYATDWQAAEWEELLRDGSAVGALAATEAAGGSSFEHIACEAAPAIDGYRITGGKTLVANAPAAGLFIVLARHAGQRGPMSLTAFLVPVGSEGLSVCPIAADGLAGAPIGTATFVDCFVRNDAVLGRPGAGLRVFSTAMQWERSCLLAGLLGAAERDLALCRDFLAARHDSGGPLLRHQALSHRLARIKLSLDGARLLLYRAASLLDAGHDDRAAAAAAKLAVSEAVVAAATDSFRLLAGAGWRGEVGDPVTAVTDTLGGLLASGTTEMQLEILARHLPSDGERAC